MKMINRLVLITVLTVSSTLFAQEIVKNDSLNNETTSQQKIKLDGVATVVGKNIVLDSEIEGYKLQLEQQSEGKVEISDCEMLEQIMDRTGRFYKTFFC
jgi:peptidyl-prolyl cis-trans isomerase SurA